MIMCVYNNGRMLGTVHLHRGRLRGRRGLSIPVMTLRLVGSSPTVFGLLDRARRGRCRIGRQLRWRGVVGKVQVPYRGETSSTEGALVGLSGLV